MTYLHELPVDHKDRNRPLVGCWYHWREGKTRKQIKDTFKIAKNTYNELGSCWTDNDLFTFDNVSVSDAVSLLKQIDAYEDLYGEEIGRG